MLKCNLHSMKILPVLLFVYIFFSSCSSNRQIDPVEQVGLPVDSLYNEALDAVYSGNPKQAASLFEEVELQHPYSTWAVKAQLMAAWAYFEANDYPRSLASIERFIELYPAHKDVEYAFYQEALHI